MGMTVPVWISAAAALVTAGVTRLVAPVWALGPHSDGGTILVQSLWATASDAGARRSSARAIGTSILGLMAAPPSPWERGTARPRTSAVRVGRYKPSPDHCQAVRRRATRR